MHFEGHCDCNQVHNKIYKEAYCHPNVVELGKDDKVTTFLNVLHQQQSTVDNEGTSSQAQDECPLHFYPGHKNKKLYGTSETLVDNVYGQRI